MKSPVHDRLRRVEGRHNTLVKELRRAFSSGELTESRACAIEGLRVVEEAIRSGLRFEAVFFSEAAQTKAERLLPQIGAHVETLVLPEKLFDGIVPSETPQGVAALVRVKEFSVDDVLRESADKPALSEIAGSVRDTQAGILVGVAGVQDPGNLGTILRSAEAFGASGVLLGENTVSPFNAKAVRASAGSIFRLPVVRTKLADVIPTLRGKSVRLLATSSHKGTPLNQANLTGPAAVFIGSEGAGLPRGVMAAVDEVIVIPHAAQVESLNAGVAASIVLYEAARQRKYC
ncbi:MAG TPA: RNA methyltransferase [Terriglobales bacterium]|nr:RNA methyltransferase [Terriglobales bacterium]